MPLGKNAIAIFNPQNPIEQAVQDTFHMITQRWMTSYEVSSFVRGVMPLCGVVNEFLSSPESITQDFFTSDSASDCIYFPCYTVELRNILHSKRYIASPHVLGFSLNAALRALRNYPVLIAVDRDKLGDPYKLRSVMIFDRDSISLENGVKRILVRNRYDNKEYQVIQKIVKEEYPDITVHPVMDVPGVQVSKAASVKTASSEKIPCPLCGGEENGRCRCRIGDRTCVNGHHFHASGMMMRVPPDGTHPVEKITVSQYVDEMAAGTSPYLGKPLAKKFVVNIPAVGIDNEPHHGESPEDAVQRALDKAWRSSGNPHKGANYTVQTYKASPFWNMIVREASIAYNAMMKNAQNNPVVPTPQEKQIFDFILGVNQKYNLGLTFRVAGGWVRDKALGKESDDIDIAIDKMTGAEFGKYISKEIGKAGNVIKANPEQSKHLETMTINLFGQDVDFVNLRSETYGDSRIPEMQFGTPQIDAERRDLTINALFYNINSQQVEDFTGKGLKDLQTMTLRTPLEPKKTFMDDPLRILRLLRFFSRYGNANIDPAAIEAMKDPEVQAALKDKVSPERIATEVKKLMGGSKPEEAARILQETGLMKSIFDVPEAAGFNDFTMDQHNPHHIDNVFEHTLKVMKELNAVARQNKMPDDRRALLLFAALFHDIGKLCPTVIGVKTVKQMIDGLEKEVEVNPRHQTYYGHEDVSTKVVRAIMQKLKMSLDEINYVTTIVQEHMEPHRGEDYWTNKNIRKYINQFGELWVDIFNHAIADAKSKGDTDEVRSDLTQKNQIMDRIRNMPPPPPKPVLNGQALMAMFPDLDPKSGFIKDVHTHLMDMQFANPNLTPEEATEAVRGMADQIRTKYAPFIKKKGPAMNPQAPQAQQPPTTAEVVYNLKVARDVADWVCGHVVRKPFGTGTKSESLQNFLILNDGTGEYLLRRSDGPAFDDAELEKLEGRSVCCKGTVHEHMFLASEVQIQGDNSDPAVQYMERKSPSEISKYEVGDKVRRRRKGLAFPQINGRVNKIEGDIMFIKWDGIKELEAVRLTDTVALYGTLEKV